MLTIYLHQLKFLAYHGLYPEEKLIGGPFEVNLSVKYLPSEIPVTNIKDTVDYGQLYEVILLAMQQPVDILETFVTSVAQQILAQFYLIQEVEISITKLQPPIAKFIGSVGVSYYLKREL